MRWEATGTPWGHARDGNAVPSRRHPPSGNGRAGREGTRWEEKMGSLVISGEKDCCVRRWSLGEVFFFAPPSSTCAQAEGITGAASQPAMPSTPSGLGAGGWAGCCFHSSLLHKTTRIWSHLAMLGMDQSYWYTYSSSQLALFRARFPSFVSLLHSPFSNNPPTVST